MSASNDFETELLNHLFVNSAIANIGDATGLPGSSTAGNLYVALHTADPGEAGKQDTNECAYTSYARVSVGRSGSTWTVSGDTVSNAAAVSFPQCTGGTETATYFSIGKESSGTTEILVSGALTSSLAISNGITPEFAIGDLTTTVA